MLFLRGARMKSEDYRNEKYKSRYRSWLERVVLSNLRRRSGTEAKAAKYARRSGVSPHGLNRGLARRMKLKLFHSKMFLTSSKRREPSQRIHPGLLENVLGCKYRG